MGYQPTPKAPSRTSARGLRRFAKSMLTLTRSGLSGARIADELRLVAASKVPMIAAKALTFAAQKAQQSIKDAMSSTFEGGAASYTLNSTRIESATADNLQARVAVKDRTSSGGNVPENYLFPGVFGGARKEKRFERLLRFSGLLQSGERVVPGQAARLDSRGNFGIGQIRSVLARLQGQVRESKGAKRRKLAARKNDLFVGAPSGGKRQAGVYRREGKKRLRPLLIFVRKAPIYTQKLDFEGIAAATAKREFEPTFLRLLRKETGAL